MSQILTLSLNLFIGKILFFLLFFGHKRAFNSQDNLYLSQQTPLRSIYYSQDHHQQLKPCSSLRNSLADISIMCYVDYAELESSCEGLSHSASLELSFCEVLFMAKL
jgi:hypothetical protein